MTIDIASLDAFFRPRSVAVVGASGEATKIGGRPVDYLKRLGFRGPVFPVNPRAGEIQGLPAFPTLRAIPGDVDLAIVSVPAALVPATIDDAISKRVKGLVVFSAGFAEVDAAGAATQADMTAKARAVGIRVLGPNCMGFADVGAGLYASFSPVISMGLPKAGHVAIISQSGAFGAYAFTLARERGLGISKWVASGNECDVDVADCIAWLAGDPETKVILAYLEGAKDGRKLMSALELVRAAGKPVVVTKVGRTEIGAAAAQSHTSALAGEDRVYDAVLRQCGAYRAETIEEFFDVGYALSRAGLPRGKQVGLFTVSGGVGVLMADDADKYGLDVAEMPADAQNAIRRLVPFAAARNPLDITGQVANDPTLMDRAIAIMLDTGRYDMIAGFQAASGLSPQGAEHLVGMAKKLRLDHPDIPLAFCSVFRPEVRTALEGIGCLAFEDPSRMIRALGAMATLAERLKSSDRSAEPTQAPVEQWQSGPMNEVDALAVLARHGVPVVEARLCRSADEAKRAATAFGFPVVAKIVSRDILHKSDMGGVRLSLGDEAAVAAAFHEIIANAHRFVPEARVDGVLLAPMIGGGVECIMGVLTDATFGPVVMFGLGGVLVEVLKDVSFRAAPFDRTEALTMIREIKGAAVLDGVRGSPPADVDALADALALLSRFAAANADHLATIDVNPFVVRAKGKGAVALDAVLIGR